MKGMLPQTVRRIYWTIFLAGSLVALYGVYTRVRATTLLGVAVLLGNMVFQFICYRCPHCGKYLTQNNITFCPNCKHNVNMKP